MSRANPSFLISSFPDFDCVCTCGSAEEALRMIPQVKPNVVLMDVFLPRLSGTSCMAKSPRIFLWKIRRLF